MLGLPDGVKNFRICVTVYTQYRRVTDRRTDIFARHTPRYAHASCGNDLYEYIKDNCTSTCSVYLTAGQFLSRISILTRDIDIAILSVCLSVRLSVRDFPGLDENGLTYCHSSFTTR